MILEDVDLRTERALCCSCSPAFPAATTILLQRASSDRSSTAFAAISTVHMPLTNYVAAIPIRSLKHSHFGTERNSDTRALLLKLSDGTVGAGSLLLLENVTLTFLLSLRSIQPLGSFLYFNGEEIKQVLNFPWKSMGVLNFG